MAKPDPEARKAEHLAYVTKLRNSHFHIGTTKDNVWGLFCPQTRRADRRWLDLPIVYYNAKEISRHYLTHDGEKFSESWLFREIKGKYWLSLNDWNDKLRIIIPQLPTLHPSHPIQLHP